MEGREEEKERGRKGKEDSTDLPQRLIEMLWTPS